VSLYDLLLAGVTTRLPFSATETVVRVERSVSVADVPPDEVHASAVDCPTAMDEGVAVNVLMTWHVDTVILMVRSS
jgi:hypothetical protein